MCIQSAPPLTDDNIAKLQQVVCPLIAVYQRRHVVQIGSGFIIGSPQQEVRNKAFIATASHVLEWAIKEDGPRWHHQTALPEFLPEKREHYLRDIELYALVTNGNGKAYPAQLSQCFFDKDRDVAFAFIHVPEEVSITGDYVLDTQMLINTRGPHVGAEVIAAGYHQIHEQVEALNPEAIHEGEVDFDGKIDIYSGTVKELFHDRGPRQHAWPCFTTDGRYPNGMSGGSIFEIIGPNVIGCGIVSSDIKDEKDDSGGCPIATILWTSLYTPTEIAVNPGLPNEIATPTILDLVKLGIINDVMGAGSHVTINADEDNNHIISWTHQNDLDTFVNKCVQRHTSGEPARFIGVFFKTVDGPKGKLAVPVLSFQKAISYHINYNNLTYLGNAHDKNWEYLLIVPNYSGISKIVAKYYGARIGNMIKLSAFLNNLLHSDSEFGSKGALFDRQGTRVDIALKE